ncbi:prolyl-tRNA synthetase associated domain-containing protein [Salinivibrio kushneri]|uniref:YbaK/EbsC family protein n=1 Tax=Salinivibrio kushneri TaxID=1908198 RepID=UPI000988BED5|nr:YbaK/EbsC family protein [Salinivibrio kushneri]QCP01988.1 prolyl-tRNA synthetase associated domain-containing protein [Salinivibrio kushneri]
MTGTPPLSGQQTALLHSLKAHGISVKIYRHQPVYTCEQADALGLHTDANPTKNLLLKDRKSKQFFLVVLPGKATVNLAGLSEALGTSRLSFASSQQLDTYLQAQSGAVSVFDVMNDPEHRVSLVIANAIWRVQAVECQPFCHDQTWVIATQDLARWLQGIGRRYQTVDHQ